jgi:hypothetical protein
MAKTATDYMNRIAALRASYLDARWSAANGWYQDAAGLADSVANAAMVQITAIEASRGVATATDKTRALTVIAKLMAAPAWEVADGTWHSFMDGAHAHEGGDYHAARDEPITEGLFYAYQYRTELGLDGTTAAAILSRLTTDRAISTSVYGSGRSLDIDAGNGSWSNQVLSDWQFNTIAYAYLLGANVGAELSASAKRFIDKIDGPKHTPFTIYDPETFLFGDFGWWYTAGMPWNSWEYGAMCYGKMVRRYPELASALSLTADEIARMKAWSRHHLGQWQRNGYPNWDTSYSDWRLHSTTYWMWGLQALIGMARATALNQGASDHLYAKWILDNAIDTWDRMDTWRGDAADGVPPEFPFGTVPQPWAAYSAYARANTWGKHTTAAKFAAYLAQAVELGVADAASADPGVLWGWNWITKDIHVSTPAYDAASLPYAPAVDIWGSANSVQLQHWGISRIAKPTGEILTATGGYGLEAFSFRVSRGGVTDIDTGDPAAAQPSQSVWRSASPETHAAFATDTIPPSMTTLRSLCSRTGTNYRVDVDTTFYPDRIRSTHRAVLTGAAGAAVAVMSVPARKDAVIEYVAADGTKTVVWNGTTLAPAGSPGHLACRYIHVKWTGFSAGLVIIPRSSTLGVGAKVTALGADPSGHPGRQPDQDRSLLVYLCDTTTAEIGRVEITHDYVLTDGTDAGAEAAFLALRVVPLKQWNGAEWVEVPIKRWNGTAWVTMQANRP